MGLSKRFYEENYEQIESERLSMLSKLVDRARASTEFVGTAGRPEGAHPELFYYTGLRLKSVRHGLAALARLLSPPVFAPVLHHASRLVLESAARSHWLMSDLDEEVVVRRLIAERFAATRELEKIGDEKERSLSSKVIEEAEADGHDMFVDSRGRVTGLGVRIPPATELAGVVIAAFYDGTVAAREHGERMYRFASGGSHGGLHVIGPAATIMAIGMIEQTTLAAVVSATAAAASWSDAFDVRDVDFDRWTEVAREILGPPGERTGARRTDDPAT